MRIIQKLTLKRSIVANPRGFFTSNDILLAYVHVVSPSQCLYAIETDTLSNQCYNIVCIYSAPC